MFLKGIIAKIKNWEAWPFAILYAPLYPVWGYYMLKSKAVWFFSTSNPKIAFGGMVGELKTDVYKLLPKKFIPKTKLIEAKMNWKIVKKYIDELQINYPVILKPDWGEQGVLVRKIDSEAEWMAYHNLMEDNYLLQELSPYKKEISIFYVRKPSETKGRITGFLQKVPLHVIGNGKDDLSTLISNHPKANKYAAEMLLKHSDNLQIIVPKDEIYFLSIAGNHNKGAQFHDYKEYISPNLKKRFDDWSIAANDLYYGRYDIMCNNIDDFIMNKNYHILEYNGCGAEPNHFYDTGYTLKNAYKEILKHWKYLYEISKENKNETTQPMKFIDGIKFLKSAQNKIKELRVIDNKLNI